MAPEMLPGAGAITTRTDVYLLGATLRAEPDATPGIGARIEALAPG